jgi:L-alanine-DL-glutamate epimerase-like enolase superfamily enzyme
MSAKVRITGVALWFLPVTTRVPLKFGTEALTSVTCARVRLTVEGADGRSATGWGETPLSVQWVWPSTSPYATRLEALRLFTRMLARAWGQFCDVAHPLRLGTDFNDLLLPRLCEDFNASGLAPASDPLPRLAALVCSSPFDLALHDAFGRLHGISPFEACRGPWLDETLVEFLSPGSRKVPALAGRPVSAPFLATPRRRLDAWHLVGGLDPLHPEELTGKEPQDGHPVLLADWIRTDGLTCLKVKLRGNDAEWDYRRLVDVGEIGGAFGLGSYTADFNCTVRDPAYVVDVLDRLVTDHPEIHRALLYVEQPFPYDLEANPIDVREVSRRKPLYLDESAHDWRLVQLGRELGWTGVALKTCKTFSGAVLSAGWAQAHGMGLMVQDLTNPMLAQVPHVQLAANLPTLLGVETNAMQFYPAASEPEARIHPGLYRRRNGCVDLSTLDRHGFGYAGAESVRNLGEPDFQFGAG